jgi:hypothetical protein
VVAGNYESRSFVQDSDGTIRLYNVDSNGRWSGGRAIGDRKAFIGSGMAAFQVELLLSISRAMLLTLTLPSSTKETAEFAFTFSNLTVPWPNL